MKVLFIGNSHTYFNDMPYLFSLLCAVAGGTAAEAVMLAHPYRDLDWHARQYYEIRFNLLYGGYDYCVIQQAAHPFPGLEATEESGKRLIALCRKCGVTPVFTVTWAEKRFPEKQQEINMAYEKFAGDTGVLLSPVGRVWEKVRGGRSDIELYWNDGEHASVYGDYLAACCHYAALTGGRASRLPCVGIDFFSGIENASADGGAAEDKAALMTELDADKCAAIQSAVDEVMYNARKGL